MNNIHHGIAEGLAEELDGFCSDDIDIPSYGFPSKGAEGDWYRWDWKDPLRLTILVGIYNGELKLAKDIRMHDGVVVDVFEFFKCDLSEPNLIEILRNVLAVEG